MFLRNFTLSALIASTSLHASHVLKSADDSNAPAVYATEKAEKATSVKRKTPQAEVSNALGFWVLMQIFGSPVGATGDAALLTNNPSTPAISSAIRSANAAKQRADQKALRQELRSPKKTKGSPKKPTHR